MAGYFFVAPTEYDPKGVKKYWKGENPAKLLEIREVLAAIDDFSIENTDAAVHQWIERTGYSAGQIINTLRLSVVGACKGPGMFDVLALVGKEQVLARIDAAVAALGMANE